MCLGLDNFVHPAVVFLAAKVRSGSNALTYESYSLLRNTQKVLVLWYCLSGNSLWQKTVYGSLVFDAFVDISLTDPVI